VGWGANKEKSLSILETGIAVPVPASPAPATPGQKEHQRKQRDLSYSYVIRHSSPATNPRTLLRSRNWGSSKEEMDVFPLKIFAKAYELETHSPLPFFLWLKCFCCLSAESKKIILWSRSLGLRLRSEGESMASYLEGSRGTVTWDLVGPQLGN
jgi:hypothetical protein